jgi:predicted transcriptional regulator
MLLSETKTLHLTLPISLSSKLEFFSHSTRQNESTVALEALEKYLVVSEREVQDIHNGIREADA